MDALVAWCALAAFSFGWGLLIWDFVVECDWIGRGIAALLGAIAMVVIIVVVYGRK